MSNDKEETVNGEPSVATEETAEQTVEKRIGCAHYKRRAKFVVSLLLEASLAMCSSTNKSNFTT